MDRANREEYFLDYAKGGVDPPGRNTSKSTGDRCYELSGGSGIEDDAGGDVRRFRNWFAGLAKQRDVLGHRRA
jgi:hypothetical protein